MRRILFVALFGLLSVGVLAAMAGSSASAEDLSPDQVARLKANCVPVKYNLQQLHASDALLRVNRGQTYEAMASKLMDTFNERLASNRLDNKATVTMAGNYRSALDTFRSDYIAYEKKLSDAIRIDCISQPNTFHATLQEARKLRTAVHTDVLRLHRLIDDYRSSVSDFLLNYERISE